MPEEKEKIRYLMVRLEDGYRDDVYAETIDAIQLLSSVMWANPYEPVGVDLEKARQEGRDEFRGQVEHHMNDFWRSVELNG